MCARTHMLKFYNIITEQGTGICSIKAINYDYFIALKKRVCVCKVAKIIR